MVHEFCKNSPKNVEGEDVPAGDCLVVAAQNYCARKRRTVMRGEENPHENVLSYRLHCVSEIGSICLFFVFSLLFFFSVLFFHGPPTTKKHASCENKTPLDLPVVGSSHKTKQPESNSSCFWFFFCPNNCCCFFDIPSSTRYLPPFSLLKQGT